MHSSSPVLQPMNADGFLGIAKIALNCILHMEIYCFE